MFITGLGTAAPPQRYTQREGWEALQASPHLARLRLRSHAILKKVLLGDNGIAARHLALDPITEVFELTPDVLQARFARQAPNLAVAAARRALADAGCEPGEMDAVIISTCTGYLCPGLTSYVSERLSLRSEVFALDLVGQGCGAALPNWRAAEAILGAGRAQRVLSICVEVCSAAFYLDDDPGVLISACLFGDGAGAAVLSAQPRAGRRRVEWKAALSSHAPEHRELLRFSHKNGMLRNILLPQVPPLAGASVAEIFARCLAANGLQREQITGWILHAGGRDVLLALREHLGLAAADVRHSAAVLNEYGNLSSPTVYFVLERALNEPVSDGWWWLSAFGAGFSCHGALLEVSA
jgi:alkylresorcinol/alkylpyrone synthase